MNRIRTAALIFPLAAIALLVSSRAEAQRRPLYPGYPYYPNYRYAMPEADLKFKVKPKEASIYIDGYYAGLVDDFDGAFERLHVQPGQHEIVVYLEGHHSLRQQLYLTPDRTRTIEGRLEPLAPGVANEPPPAPREIPDEERGGRYTRPAPPRVTGGRLDPGDQDPRDQDPRGRDGDRDGRDREPQTRPLPPSTASGASLAVRVQPAGATVLVDGQRWQGPSDDNERLIIQVAEGHHTIEVQRDGYEPFVTQLDVRQGQTVPVNVSLRRDR